MITPPNGAERHQLVKWATPRLLRYYKSRRKSLIIFVNNFHPCYPGCGCGPMNMTKDALHTIAAKEAELTFINGLLRKRPHVKKKA